MSMDFASGKELCQLCREHSVPISAVMLRREMELGGVSERSVRERLARSLQIMGAAVHEPLEHPQRSLSGLIGGEAWKVYHAAAWNAGAVPAQEAEESGGGPCSERILPPADEAWRSETPYEEKKAAMLCGEALTRAIAYSMAVLEVNAAMGLIVAAPTAGSSGVLPGAVLSLSEIYGWPEAKQIDGLLNAGAVGYLLMRNATVAGAEAGCQAEVGAASAMTASAIVELLGGTPEMCFQAASLAVSNLLGLVCDPIAGLVEVPCQSRNAIGVANAFTCAQLALSGITHPVPFDEMAEAMYRVGRSLPWELRESARGGNAGTPTGRRCSAGGGCADGGCG